MQYRKLAQTDMTVSAVALGAWAIGGGPWWGENDDDLSVRAIHAALDAGINLIDTAPVYGFGHSEEVVGRALKGRREKVILSTKCGLWWHSQTGGFSFELDGRKVYRNLGPDTIRQEVEHSFRRLGTDYIDILHTHWQEEQPGHTPIPDTMDCLMELRRQGKIRAIAVSNASCGQMDEYRAHGILSANQPHFSMLDREIEANLVPYCLAHDISILAYSHWCRGC
jgi:methylglyoxal reductase